jgi:hypothetical protein
MRAAERWKTRAVYESVPRAEPWSRYESPAAPVANEPFTPHSSDFVCAIGGGGTLAVYLPELFPTVVRGPGAGFCWNPARRVAGVSPVVTGLLVAIWFGPETRGLALRDA